MASDEEEEGRVGELFTWGQATGGSKVDLLAFRSCKASAAPCFFAHG
jgi:hypothetical protein